MKTEKQLIRKGEGERKGETSEGEETDRAFRRGGDWMELLRIP